MRHRVRGRHLGRTASHRKAMFRNMAVSLIKSVRPDEDDPKAPKVKGRITTTVPKAKEIRPFVEKLVTLARKSLPIQRKADELNTSAERNSAEWKTWRESPQWNEWNQAIAPVIAMRRKAFSLLRDKEAVDILFSELAEQFEERNGGYTRIIKLAKRRLGDGGQQALIEFVGDESRDRVKKAQTAPVVTDAEPESDAPAAETEAEQTQESEEEVSQKEEGTVDSAEAETEEIEASTESETEEEKEQYLNSEQQPLKALFIE